MSQRTAPPALPPPVEPRLPPVHHTRLDNGLELLVVERSELPVIDARLVVRAGADYDSQDYAGRAFLTADLLDEGTAKRTALQLADESEHLGASLATHATWDYTAADLHVLTARIEPAFELLADIAIQPAFPGDEVERKRAERLAAILHEHDDPRALANIAFAHAVYRDRHPFGAPIGGTRSSVEKLTTEDLRDFYQHHFGPANAFLVIVGDITATAATDLALRMFGEWHGATPKAPPTWPAPAICPRTVHIIHRPNAPQSELRVGCFGPARSTPDYFPLLVANTVLGGAFTSRLNMRLREEKAYTYGAASRFSFRREGGPFVAATAVFTGATADAVHEIIGEIERLGSEPVSDDELERAQSYLVLGLPRTFETTGDIAEHVVDVELYGLGRDFFDTFGARVRAVTAQQVTDVSARWLPAEQMAIVVVGDATVIEKELRDLELGTVEVVADV
jgi:predicted Zn-dependent peptidase